jgi:glutamate synthase domain-containing protein 3
MEKAATAHFQLLLPRRRLPKHRDSSLARRWYGAWHGPTDIVLVRGLIEDHHHYTGPELAARILLDFNRALPRLVVVLPTDCKRVPEGERSIHFLDLARTWF